MLIRNTVKEVNKPQGVHIRRPQSLFENKDNVHATRFWSERILEARENLGIRFRASVRFFYTTKQKQIFWQKIFKPLETTRDFTTSATIGLQWVINKSIDDIPRRLQSSVQLVVSGKDYRRLLNLIPENEKLITRISEAFSPSGMQAYIIEVPFIDIFSITYTENLRIER